MRSFWRLPDASRVRNWFVTISSSAISRWTISTWNVFPFGFLSDGLKSMVAITADIALRCILLDPHPACAAPKETGGVAPMNELDIHLHPNWKRSDVRNLATKFPISQFVAATQSL